MIRKSTALTALLPILALLAALAPAAVAQTPVVIAGTADADRSVPRGAGVVLQSSIPDRGTYVDGSGFTGATAVTVGDRAVWFRVLSDTRLVFQMPLDVPVTLDAPITVTTPSGSATSAWAVTIDTSLGSDLGGHVAWTPAGRQLAISANPWGAENPNLDSVRKVTVDGAAVPTWTLNGTYRLLIPVQAFPSSPVSVELFEDPAGQPGQGVAVQVDPADAILLNGVAPGQVGQFDIVPAVDGGAGEVYATYLVDGGNVHMNSSFIASHYNYLDTGVGLVARMDATGRGDLALTGPNRATSTGVATGVNGDVEWTVTATIDGQRYDARTDFTAAPATQLGQLAFATRLDEDAMGGVEDYIGVYGTGNDVLALLVDMDHFVGFSQSGYVTDDGSGRLAAATWDGFAVGNYSALSTRISDRTQVFGHVADPQPDASGNINTSETPLVDPQPADAVTAYYGGAGTDAGSALRWTLDPTASAATVTHSLVNVATSLNEDPLLDVSVTGSGTVTSDLAGIDCGATCRAEVPRATSVTLSATPDHGHRFAGWGGACSGTAPTCTVTVDLATAVAATFETIPPVPAPQPPATPEVPTTPVPTLTVPGRHGAPVPDPARNSDTAVSVARVAFPQGLPADGPREVLLASESVFADALASGMLQGGRPLLLTDPDGLEAAVTAEIDRLGAGVIRILGGVDAVSQEVEDALVALGYEVVRIAGPTRLETAIEVARLNPDAGTAILARAYAGGGTELTEVGDPTQAFADSLGAGAWSAAADEPVLLTDTGQLSEATARYLRSSEIRSVRIVGGEAAVSDDVRAALDQLGIAVERVPGITRFHTAVEAAAARGFGPGRAVPVAVILAEGQAPDAWAAGFTFASLSARYDLPLVLSNGEVLPGVTATFLEGVDPLGTEDGTTLFCAAAEAACASAEAILAR